MTTRRKTNRVAWGLAAILAVASVGGNSALAVRVVAWLGAYRVARRGGIGINLPAAWLPYTDLTRANLQRGNLPGADLRGAHLGAALLMGANLRKADLRGADLEEAVLGGGCFPMADLSGADLRGANFRRTEMEAYTRGGSRKTVKLTNARYDNHTRWPAGFDPLKHGAVLVR